MSLNKISDYDQSVLVAESDTKQLYIVKYGNYYKFCELYKQTKEVMETLIGVEDHWNLTNKTQFVTNAFDIATKYHGFTNSEVLNKFPKNKTVTITESERVAINTALQLLKHSNSDHADQACCHLQTLVNKF